MEFRRFNEMGVKAFAAYLDTLRSIPAAPVPIQLLTDPSLTQALDQPISAEPRTFTTRMEFALWLDEATRHSNSDVPHRDIGFWAWLTLFLFENVCPGDSQGRHKLKEDARYLPMLDSPRRYYRHSLVGPYAIFKLYEHKPEQADALLCGSLAKLTDEAYRLFVENQLVFYPAAVSILSSFYFDANRKILRRGSQTKKPGSIRRLARVLTQYARTFDLDIVPYDRLSQMLPREFSRWRANAVGLFTQYG